MRTNAKKNSGTAKFYEQIDEEVPSTPHQTSLLEEEKKAEVSLPATFEPTEFTVIVGREKSARESPGTRRLRQLAKEYILDYSRAHDRRDKSAIVSQIMQRVASTNGGMFVRKNRLENRWYQVEDAVAREKIGYTFRDLLGERYRSSSKSKLAKNAKRQRDIFQPMLQMTDFSTAPSERARQTMQHGRKDPMIDIHRSISLDVPQQEFNFPDRRASTFPELPNTYDTTKNGNLDPLPFRQDLERAQSEPTSRLQRNLERPVYSYFPYYTDHCFHTTNRGWLCPHNRCQSDPRFESISRKQTLYNHTTTRNDLAASSAIRAMNEEHLEQGIIQPLNASSSYDDNVLDLDSDDILQLLESPIFK